MECGCYQVFSKIKTMSAYFLVYPQNDPFIHGKSPTPFDMVPVKGEFGSLLKVGITILLSIFFVVSITFFGVRIFSSEDGFSLDPQIIIDLMAESIYSLPINGQIKLVLGIFASLLLFAFITLLFFLVILVIPFHIASIVDRKYKRIQAKNILKKGGTVISGKVSRITRRDDDGIFYDIEFAVPIPFKLDYVVFSSLPDGLEEGVDVKILWHRRGQAFLL